MRAFTPLPAIALLALGLLGLGLPACAPNPQQPTIDKEDRLAAAGFRKRPIRTEAQLADFRQIPAHLIRPATWRGKIVYIYADRTICGCLYIGSPKAYDTYISGAQARFVQASYKSATTDSGYTASPWMLDGGPWDDADMYGTYID